MAVEYVDGLNYAKLAEKLREELRRQGIVWYLYADWYARSKTPPQRGRAPWIGGGTFMNAGQRLRNGNTMICDYEAHCVYEVTKDWRVVWQFGEFGVAGSDLTHLNHPHFVCVDEDTGKVLIADSANHRVLEVDYTTKKVLHTLAATASGAFHDPHCAVYTPDGHLLISNLNDHYVVETDWTGVEYWSAGLYGTSGQTEVPLRLYGPTAAFPYPPGKPEYVVISDYGNDRVLAVKRDRTIAWRMVASRPECARPALDLRLGVASEGELCFAVDRNGALLTYVPYMGPYFEPTIDGTYLLSEGNAAVMEFDPHYFRPYALPKSRSLLTGYSLPANESVGPIYSGATHIENMQVLITFPYDKVTFYVRSTQAATFTPLIARTVEDRLDSLRFNDWISIDSVSLTANVWEVYTVVPHAPMMGALITMGSTGGVVDVFVSRLPKEVA